MNPLRLLVLTDHGQHGSHESLYPLLRTMLQHPACQQIEVASRSTLGNMEFFQGEADAKLWGISVDKGFQFERKDEIFASNTRKISLQSYDWVLLRIPKPNPLSLFQKIQKTWGDRVINRPENILETGSKAFLLNFPESCPPMKLCYSVAEILNYSKEFPIVLKPFLAAGGKGILKIEEDQVWEGSKSQPLADMLPALEQQAKSGYLAMKFLSHVDQGDKRILVVNGHIVGASLRLPGEGSWMCNIAQGGSSTSAMADSDEQQIVAQLHPVMQEKGIVLYGIDTLMGDQGKRVLSEINTSCAGGIYPAEQVSGEPVVQRTADRLWEYMTE